MIYFVNQPFGTGYVKGILPHLFTDQRLVFNERVYIYALEEYHRLSDYPLELHQECFNHKRYDNMPDDEKLPVNAILGFVDVREVIAGARQIDEGEHVYAVTNAHMFVAPLEVEPDEIYKHDDIILMMNTQMFVPRVPSLRNGGTEFLCPTEAFHFELSKYGQSFKLDLSPSLAKLLLDENGDLKPITKLTLWCGSVAKSYLVEGEVEIVYRKENMDELQRCPRIFPESDERVGAMVQFPCNHHLYD